jgi:biopolymer transport protein ExbD
MKPQINVTPLIDVLLVLLIIFIVISPLRPTAFKTRIPSEPSADTSARVHPDTLVVNLRPDLRIELNGTEQVGSVEEPQALTSRLSAIFAERMANGSVTTRITDVGRPYSDGTERTVFIKAGRSMNYGSVARLVDAVKLGGAYPISLQIDRLE